MTLMHIISFIVGGVLGFLVCAFFVGAAVIELEEEIMRRLDDGRSETDA